MSNTLLTPTIIGQTALIALENNLVMGGLVHRDYSNEFQRIGSTVIVRVPPVFYATAVSDTVSVNPITESSVAVVLNKHWDVTLEITTQQLTLNVVSFSELVTLPAMMAIAQAVDNLIFSDNYKTVAGHQAVSATPAASDIGGLDAVLSVLKCPMSERRLVFHPITKADYVTLNAFMNAEKRGDTRAIRDASMGRVLGFDCYVDQNVPTHTAGITTAAALTGTVVTAGTAGATGTMTIGSLGTAETINVGDLFKITGEDSWHTVSTLETCDGGSATVIFTPVIQQTVATGKVVTFQNSHRANLAFHKNAFALVTRPLEPPVGGARGATMSYKGLSARVVYDYTMYTKTNVISFDLLCGTKVLNANLAARLADAR